MCKQESMNWLPSALFILYCASGTPTENAETFIKNDVPVGLEKRW